MYIQICCITQIIKHSKRTCAQNIMHVGSHCIANILDKFRSKQCDLGQCVLLFAWIGVYLKVNTHMWITRGAKCGTSRARCGKEKQTLPNWYRRPNWVKIIWWNLKVEGGLHHFELQARITFLTVSIKKNALKVETKKEKTGLCQNPPPKL